LNDQGRIQGGSTLQFVRLFYENNPSSYKKNFNPPPRKISGYVPVKNLIYDTGITFLDAGAYPGGSGPPPKKFEP